MTLEYEQELQEEIESIGKEIKMMDSLIAGLADKRTHTLLYKSNLEQSLHEIKMERLNPTPQKVRSPKRLREKKKASPKVSGSKMAEIMAALGQTEEVI